MRRAVFLVILLSGISPRLLAQRFYGPEFPRYEVGLQADITNLTGIGKWGGGLGFRFNYNFTEHVALDSELIFRQHDLLASYGAITQSAVVGQTTGLFGVGRAS